MRLFAVLFLFAIGCTHTEITPEPDGGTTPGDAAKPDAANPDGGSPDGSSSSNAGWQSGSRLRARVNVGSDGSKNFAGWFDNQRKENCFYGTAADGVPRCLPLGGAQIQDVYFVDAQCTQSYATVPKGCAAPKYGQHIEPTGCGLTFRYRIFTVGSLNNGPTIYTKSGNQCMGQQYNSGTMPDFYIPTAEVTPSSFVDGPETTE